MLHRRENWHPKRSRESGIAQRNAAATREPLLAQLAHPGFLPHSLQARRVGATHTARVADQPFVADLHSPRVEEHHRVGRLQAPILAGLGFSGTELITA